MNSNPMLERTVALRSDAWNYVRKTAAYDAFKALDAAVVAMGGDSTMPVVPDSVGVRINASGAVSHSPITKALLGRRVSQGDAAQEALLKVAKPIPASELIEAARSEGASIGGEKPMVSFTSSLSKDDRFYSFRREATYYWWLKDMPLPPGWDEGPPSDYNDLLGGASVIHSNQEGGDGDAPATT